MNLTQYFIAGGSLMYVLGFLSVLAVAVALAKLYQFYRCGVYSVVSTDELERRIAAGAGGEVSEMVNSIGDASPVERVLKVALRCFAHKNFSFEIAKAEISRKASLEIQNLEAAFKVLAAIAYLSPLIGLLGTVFGMINAFASLESAGRAVSPSLLAGGIWEALLTTAFGLSIAIVALCFQYYFESVVDAMKLRLASEVTRVQTAMAAAGWHVAIEGFHVEELQSKLV